MWTGAGAVPGVAGGAAVKPFGLPGDVAPTPDHVASTLGAMMMGLEVYEAYPGGRAGNVRDYYEYARDNDLYVSYVIMDPQGDRSKSTGERGNADLAVAILKDE